MKLRQKFDEFYFYYYLTVKDWLRHKLRKRKLPTNYQQCRHQKYFISPCSIHKFPYQHMDSSGEIQATIHHWPSLIGKDN